MNEMKKSYEEITYKNIEGYKATFTDFHVVEEHNGNDIEISLERDGEIFTYKLPEAYRIMLALQTMLKTHDPDYELKMMSSLEKGGNIV